MVRSLKVVGGTHDLTDFAATECSWTEPVSGRYRGHDLLEHPPNGQGATAILILKILAHFDLAALDPLGPQRAHLEAEAAKLAYDARDRFIADPDFTTRLDHMISDDTAARLAALIDPRRVIEQVAKRTEAVHRDTVYLTVVDCDRMAVSLIYSTYWGFGSGIASEKFGILFQNRGAGFNLTEGHPNEAGRRQASDAHDHPGNAAPRRPRDAAVRRDGRILPADGPCSCRVEPARLRHGPARGDRRATLDG